MVRCTFMSDVTYFNYREVWCPWTCQDYNGDEHQLIPLLPNNSLMKMSTIYSFLKQCCSIFGLKVVEKNFYATFEMVFKDFMIKEIYTNVFYQMYFILYWLQFYLLCIYIHVQTFILMFWFYFSFDITRNYGISFYISRFGKHFKKTFWEPFCCSFELGPPYCLAFVTSQHLICHIWPSLY